ncbi:hypothetical protein RVR_8261 [Actinacidiphila reveromycinica]|uniref:Uncharacterized protein n=1 Tax=Actinacidiphila reveromycinica TaxID=659352 RepID=A0A7U3UYP8_9ACTN|nr:hypothetical protein [Streptomyces sp. SN-593]BBB01029.1 hypothetical protein RVR_8261 [Streptomyces sp. SN-593]
MTTAVRTPPSRRYINRKQRDLNIARGIPNRVNTAIARAHILELRKTMGWNAIAAATGCSACHLRYIADGRTTTINRVTHQKILRAKPASTSTRGLYIDATGTRRRVRALQAIGYSQQAIAEAADTTQHRISVISLGAERVRQKIADKIADAYRQLAHHTPPDNAFTCRARNHAAAQKWLTPDFWEDYDRIDDPQFDPTATLPTKQILAEDARWFMAMDGLTVTQAADRLGRSVGYIRDCLDEYPEQGAAA